MTAHNVYSQFRKYCTFTVGTVRERASDAASSFIKFMCKQHARAGTREQDAQLGHSPYLQME